jgi:hypothetical protein
MPSIHLDPTKKGLVQRTGNVVSGDTLENVALQTLTGNDETISTADKGMLIRVDAGGGNRTGIILQQGTVDGQMIVLVNVGGESITMAAAGVSFVALGASCVVAAGASLFCVYDSTTQRWHATET